MEHKNKPAPAARIWALYLIVGVLFMAGVVFFSNWKALCTTEERFCQILDFVKSQSTRYEKYNDTVAAKTLRRTAVSVQALADDPALDFSDPQCLKKEAERLWLTGISVLDPKGTLLLSLIHISFEEDRQNALKAGMNGHIAKPLDVPRLLSILADALK